jgi:hypothetical protein
MLTAPHDIEYGRFVPPPLMRNQHRHGPTDYFIRAVSEDPLGGSFPTEDEAAQGLADDGTINGESREPLSERNRSEAVIAGAQ